MIQGKLYRWVGLALFLFYLTGCDRGGSGNNSQGSVVPLEGLKYAQNPMVFSLSTSIPEQVPVLDKGVATSYAISHALPEGLTFDTKTGTISGTPSAQTKALVRYTITASNEISSKNVEIDVVVLGIQRFCACDYNGNRVFIVDPSNPDKWAEVSRGIVNPIAVAAGDNCFAIAGYNKLTIIDATKYTSLAEIPINFEKIVYGNSKFAAIDPANSKIIVIDTKNQYTSIEVPLEGEPTAIAYGENMFAVAHKNYPKYFVSFIDAISPKIVKSIEVENESISLVYGSGYFVIVPKSSDPGMNTVTLTNATTFSDSNVQVQNSPLSVAYGNNRFAVTNYGSHTVSIIDPTLTPPAVIKNVDVGDSPEKVVYGNNQFAVLSTIYGEVTLIDSRTDQVVFTKTLGKQLNCIAFGNYHYLVASQEDLFLIDSIQKGLQKVNMRDYKTIFSDIAFSRSTDNISFCVVMHDSQKASFIDPWSTKILKTVSMTMPDFPSIAYGNNRFAIASYDTVTIIDAQKHDFLYSVEIEKSLKQIVYGNKYFATTNYNAESKLSIINAEEYEPPKVIEFTSKIYGIAYGNKRFAIVNGVDKEKLKVSFIDSQTHGDLGFVELNDFLQNQSCIVYGNKRFAVTNQISETKGELNIIDAQTPTLLATIEVEKPSSLWYGNKRFVVTNKKSNTVIIIDAEKNTVLATILLGYESYSHAYGNNRFIIASSDYGNINNGNINKCSILDAYTYNILATIPIGNPGYNIAYGNNRFIVANENSNSLTIIDAIYNILVDTIPVPGSPKDIASSESDIEESENP